MESGDEVLTHQEERGVILKPWDRDDDQYNWWVEIRFTADGKEYTSVIPYKESELKVENSRQQS